MKKIVIVAIILLVVYLLVLFHKKTIAATSTKLGDKPKDKVVYDSASGNLIDENGNVVGGGFAGPTRLPGNLVVSPLVASVRSGMGNGSI